MAAAKKKAGTKVVKQEPSKAKFGGKRKGAGRPAGKRLPPKTVPKNKVKVATAQTDTSGLLPHEILLKAARGEMFNIKKLIILYHKTGSNKGHEKERYWEDSEYWPNYKEQMEAAKAAASYYAPRLVAQTIKAPEGDAVPGVMLVPLVNADEWGKISQNAQAQLKQEVRS